ncbi:MAG: hypothetical protein JJT82_09205 [Legionellaceae bacterium]|nr:hypothetical protein [Legionellaceae bacterium]
MPNLFSTTFRAEKKIWRQTYLHNLLALLQSDDKQLSALSMREGIKKNDNRCPRKEIKTALEAIDLGGDSPYSGDLPRAHGAIKNLNFLSQKQIEALPRSTRLTIDALLMEATADGLLTARNAEGKTILGPIDQAFQEKMALVEDVEELFAGKKAFTNEELPQWAAPLLRFYLLNQQVRAQLAQLPSEHTERQLLQTWQNQLDTLFQPLQKDRVSEEDYDAFVQQFQQALTNAPPGIQKKYWALLPPRGGLALLADTVREPGGNGVALGRTLLAIEKGDLSVNGQMPDKDYPLGEYLVHGGRVKFDLSALTRAQQETFFRFISAEQAKERKFATHRAGGMDASGSPAETKSGLWGVIADVGRTLLRTFGKAFYSSTKAEHVGHYGLNLAIGGSQIPAREGNTEALQQRPDESGEWGHMYLHKARDLLLLGLEPSAPGKNNRRTGETHSTTGASGERSGFLELKINSKALHEAQIASGKTPLSTTEKYNWATVKLSTEQCEALYQEAKEREQPDTTQSYAELVYQTPPGAEKAAPERMQKMQAWAKATKNGNKTSWAAKLCGGLLVAAGIVLALVPIPVVTQALGGSMIALGAGLAIGVVGASLFGYGSYRNTAKASELYAKHLQKYPRIITDASSPKKPDSTRGVLETMSKGSAKPEPEPKWHQDDAKAPKEPSSDNTHDASEIQHRQHHASGYPGP